MLRLYNTATKRIEPITPLHNGEVGFYACGPTVYQRAHIGNLRAYLLEDVFRRSAEMIEGVRVRHVMNITDVGHLVGDGDEGDDKIERSAREAGGNAWDIAEAYTRAFLGDLRELNILLPTVMPKATDHIAEQINLVRVLETKGMTYRTSDGIYFDTAKFSNYGLFSGQRLDEKEEGARVAANLEKRNPADFALWKFSAADGPKRQMEWESPWGVGFPGWHVECSAMSRKELGQPFDVHAGGVDHIPVHHENEIAQSVAAYGVPLAKHWMHVEFLMVDGRKMSKSLGNAYTLDDVKARGISPLALRLFMLGAHYRSKQNFTWEAVEGAGRAYGRLERAVRSWEGAEGKGVAAIEEQFRDAICDDLNAPEALAALWELVGGDFTTQEKASSFIFMDRVLGLGLSHLVGACIQIPQEIKELAERRWRAKQDGKWDIADALRKELYGRGWLVRDERGRYELERVQSELK